VNSPEGFRGEQKDKIMKKLSYPAIALVAGLLVSATSAFAGGADTCCSASCCNDRTAASPKVRAMLDERCASKCTPASQTASTISPNTAIAASPKQHQMRSDSAPVVSTQTAGSPTTVSDGIAASPKVRAQLDERRQSVVVAPLK
jgi:hypothetical protein